MEIYRDKNLAVIIKPIGMDSENDIPELLRLKTGGSIYCVHRLDKAVGGVMLFARNKKAAADLSVLVSSKDGFKKEYLAVIPDDGMLPNKGIMRDFLYHDTKTNKTFVVKNERRGVKEAELEYVVVQRKSGLALVRIQLLTGRSHQIRIQFASRKLPLVGDKKYGSRINSKSIALWSYSVSVHIGPGNEEKTFSSVPSDVFPWSEFDISAMNAVNTEV